MQNIGTMHQNLLLPSLRDAALHSSYQNLKKSLADWHRPTAEHSIRVRIQAANLGIALGLTGQELTYLSLGAELHDIGKLRVPRDILDNPDHNKNTEMEYSFYHPIWGVEIISSAFARRPDILACVLQHHEREDGSGYPESLTGNQIHLFAKIIAVADTFVAMKENTPDGENKSGYALMRLLNEEKRNYDQHIVKTLAHITMNTSQCS